MAEAALRFERFEAWWNGRRVLHPVEFEVPRNGICAVIGPSGVGKSTLLRSVNRLNEGMAGWRTEGRIRLGGGVEHREPSLPELRRRVGMVFQKPSVFPRSILENVLFGLKYTGRANGTGAAAAQTALAAAGLWGEVRDRLSESAMTLSLGQQQRLCLARALAVEPEVLLLDEPTASLDPRASAAVEETLLELRASYTMVLVTHNLLQARRLASSVAFMYAEDQAGSVVEHGPAERVLRAPADPRTAAFMQVHAWDAS